MWISPPHHLATRNFLRFILALLALTLAGCAPPLNPATDTPDPSNPESPCGWVWASQTLPELSQSVENALRANGLPDASARAEAYGEDCVDSAGNIVRSATMQTDFYITLPAAHLSDSAELGALLEATLDVLAQFPPSQTPGPQPGYIGIAFQANGEELRLWISPTRLAELRASGLSGAALFEALNTP
ncbi:MAG: hypothetical protein WHV44_13340 [Anaerolineales bacterium]